MAKTALAPNAGGLDLIPGHGTRSHMPQLRPGTAKEINKTDMAGETSFPFPVLYLKGFKFTRMEKKKNVYLVTLAKVGFSHINIL